jgi:hypothetical protein
VVEPCAMRGEIIGPGWIHRGHLGVLSVPGAPGPHDRAGAALAEAHKSVLKSNVSLDGSSRIPAGTANAAYGAASIQAIRRSAPSGCLSCQAHGPSRGSRLNPDKGV